MDIKPDPYRYINWALYVLAALINSIPTQAFSGVSPIITDVYAINEFEANLTSLIYPISYIFILLPANYIIDKKGLKLATLLCKPYLT
jgi:fucose permease